MTSDINALCDRQRILKSAVDGALLKRYQFTKIEKSK